jgi:hypothetical protein
MDNEPIVLEVPPPPPLVELDVVELEVGMLGVSPLEHANAPAAISTATAAEGNIFFVERMMRFLIAIDQQTAFPPGVKCPLYTCQ